MTTSRFRKTAPAANPANTKPITEKTMSFLRFLDLAMFTTCYDTPRPDLFHYKKPARM
jgi:hypothetical protein